MLTSGKYIMKIKGLLFSLLFICISSLSFANDKHEILASGPDSDDGEFNVNEYIFNHIKDAHEWHLWTTSDGHHVNVSLPVILFSKFSGLHVFMSNKFAHGSSYKGFAKMTGGEYKGKIVKVDQSGSIIEVPLDFSITKNVAGMLVVIIVMLIVFTRMGKLYNNEKAYIPRGIFGIIEIVIIFIRDQVAIPNIGEKKYLRFMPYLLTVFFFILINNLFGLIPFFPFGANITGNIAVTLVLAAFTLVITALSGTKEYWKHIVAPPGVPLWLSPIIMPIEVAGIFIRPFALMVRLFANITAGHIIVLSLVGLIFIFRSLTVAPATIALVLFMDFLEILVAVLQAYVFTLLSALFIGLAAKEHED